MKKTLGILLTVLPCFCFAQQEPNYPQHYFANPLHIPIFLAGNYGECRPGHFHAGADIKTLGKENQPVYAAADGYISRIKMDNGGYGHALYITHPNGYTTLYGHLNDFAPAIQQYLKEQQYKQQKWDIDIQISPQQFPVKKGQQIAWSGTTGSSTAPHLHFEIRDTKTEHPLNPEQFGLPLTDKVPPVPYSVAVYNMESSIYEQEPEMIKLQKKGTSYKAETDTIITGAVMSGIGLDVEDFMNGSDNTLAFYKATLFMNDTLETEIVLDNIGFDQARYVNAYSDYKTKKTTGRSVQLFFQLPGNRLNNVYRYLNADKGGLKLYSVHAGKIRIEVTDDKGNTSSTSFYLKYAALPDIKGSRGQLFKANTANNFNDPNVKFTLDAKALYDDIRFIFSKAPDEKAFSDHYMIHYPFVPVHNYYDLYIKPNKPIPFDLHDKIAMIYSDNKDTDGRAAIYSDQGWYKATVRNFGTYWLVADTTAPVIVPLQKEGSDLSKAKRISFEVKDDLTSVKEFSGYIDGKWICMEQHNELYFYTFDSHCSKGKHELVFTATDESGNICKFNLTFTR